MAALIPALMFCLESPVSSSCRVPSVSFSLIAIIRAAARMLWHILVFKPA